MESPEGQKNEKLNFHFLSENPFSMRSQKLASKMIKIKSFFIFLPRIWVEVSILCSNPEISIQDAVWLMFNRWLQENDFKYLSKHFGIDQLDSYAWNSFEEKAFEFHDKKIESEDYKRLKLDAAGLIRNISGKLYKLNSGNKKLKELETEQISIEASLKLPGMTHSVKLKRALTNVKKKIKKVRRNMDNPGKQISELEKQYGQIEKKQADTLSKISKIQYLIDNSYSLLNVRRKAYIDAVRVNAANIFRSLNDTFRTIYDNFRDDHCYLRILTRAPAIVYSTHSSVNF